ncbi:hypothetical protein PXK58_00925 [Phaeobacter gallaeciensis]|uniref:hypothetical protein n=1 Tax=Phaeobacter gallaeciensis TaxID=60890 RepID=UPI0023800BBC|nr:hypothetical protein [Phaeobacter gallaeciensis]MDE4272951.1 hypothetical protein [Phaeobacter gallaeciensis]MDE4298096.1 hypothetical protein [Phaeobacter gallaeciensis]MDE5183284.1 hypothetical protein [Phaeobacter gallaeciensis]
MADPTFTAPPEAPNRDEHSNGTYSGLMDAFLSWMATFAGELANLVTWIGERAAAAEAAAGGADAIEWVSEAAYTAGESVVYSPVDLQSYRARTTHSGLTTDPSADPTNWASFTIGKTPTLDSLTVSGATSLTGLQEAVVPLSGAAPVIDFSLGTRFTLTTTENAALTVANFSAGCGALVTITVGGAHSLDWTGIANLQHPDGGTVPAAPGSGETNSYIIRSDDGTNVILTLAEENISA